MAPKVVPPTFFSPYAFSVGTLLGSILYWCKLMIAGIGTSKNAKTNKKVGWHHFWCRHLAPRGGTKSGATHVFQPLRVLRGNALGGIPYWCKLMIAGVGTSKTAKTNKKRGWHHCWCHPRWHHRKWCHPTFLFVFAVLLVPTLVFISLDQYGMPTKSISTENAWRLKNVGGTTFGAWWQVVSFGRWCCLLNLLNEPTNLLNLLNLLILPTLKI